MVSSHLADALTDPTLVLQELFTAAENIDDFIESVAPHFSSVFSPQDAFNEISSLNINAPPEAHKDRALVRFRAMIQDTSASPEMYLAKRTSGRCGGWGLGEEDETTGNEDHDNSIAYTDLRECTVLWAVNIPGESPWCADVMNEQPITTAKHLIHSSFLPHKFPIPDTPHIGVQVKIYENPRIAESLRSTDIRTFIGILTSEPLHADLDLTAPSLVPTLHVLFSRPVPPTIIPRVYPCSPSATEIRDELIAWIADEGLAGDRDAAEWIVLCIIARVQSRSPPILPPALTISRFPSANSTIKDQTPVLLQILSHILPMLSLIPLSLNMLNATSFTPESKDEDLHSAWLQLPSRSICVVTEAGVTEGRVSERGLTNLRILQEVMNTQTLEYVFPFSSFVFETSINFLLLSEGRKSSFFQTSINIPLHPSKSGSSQDGLYKTADAIALPSPHKLDLYREYLCSAMVGNVGVGESTAQHIQDDFVNQRQAGVPADNFSSDDLIHRMMVARLLALSLHQTEITVDTWERMKILESTRLSRLV